VIELRAPDEHGAEERSWRVVAAAFDARAHARPRRRVRTRTMLVLAAVAAVAAAAATPPGRAVVHTVREAIGVANADRALYSLPGGGRVLAGGWLVGADGSTRHLGDYAETSWSPYGRFVVATSGGDAIVALTPAGDVRWRLARPDVAVPRWGGTHDDTRIAYLSGQHLRIVAGDGTDDHRAAPGAVARVAPAWRNGTPFTIAYADRLGRVTVRRTETGRVLYRTPAGALPRRLLWAGEQLVVVRPTAIETYSGQGKVVDVVRGRFLDAAFVGGSLALLSPHRVTLGGRTLFRTTGRLGQLVASPDGRRLLVTWPEADQWLFVPVHGGHVRAVGDIAEQLDGAFAVDGWTS